VGWKNRYLFVRESCGGGNAWRCNVEHIFRVSGDRLVELGVIFAHPESRDAGSGYGEGYFRDVYNTLEMNSITSHAAAPGFWVWLKEKNGRLVADLGRTWQENAAGYAERVVLMPLVSTGLDSGACPRPHLLTLELTRTLRLGMFRERRVRSGVRISSFLRS
jgi:hypothetical protein